MPFTFGHTVSWGVNMECQRTPRASSCLPGSVAPSWRVSLTPGGSGALLSRGLASWVLVPANYFSYLIYDYDLLSPALEQPMVTNSKLCPSAKLFF